MESPRGATEKSSHPLICRRSAARHYFQHSTWGSRPRLFIFRASGAPLGTTYGPGKPKTTPNSEMAMERKFLIPHSQFLIRLGCVMEESEIRIPNPPAAAVADQASSEGGGHDPPAGDGASRWPEAYSKSEMAMERKFLIPNS